MADVNVKYGTEAQTITISPASVTQGSFRESTVVDNTTNKFLDAYVWVQVKTGTGTIANQKAVNIYCYGTVDAATPNYPDTITGSDAALTPVSPTELTLLGVIFTPAQTTTYKSQVWSVANTLGIYLPEKWGIVLENQSGVTLDATGGNFKALYQGVYASVV